MAAATAVSKPFNNVNGIFREKVYSAVTIAANGDTLATGLKTIFAAYTTNPGVITSTTFSGGTVTFNATGAASAFALKVVGR